MKESSENNNIDLFKPEILDDMRLYIKILSECLDREKQASKDLPQSQREIELINVLTAVKMVYERVKKLGLYSNFEKEYEELQRMGDKFIKDTIEE